MKIFLLGLLFGAANAGVTYVTTTASQWWWVAMSGVSFAVLVWISGFVLDALAEIHFSSFVD